MYDGILYIFGAYTFIAFALIIASTSWMINQTNSDRWRDKIKGVIADGLS